MSKGPPYTSIDAAAAEPRVLPAALPETLPPALPSGRVLCGDLNIRIDRDGVWYYAGSPIARRELVCLFASVLVRDAAGTFWLVTPAEICPVQVDDAPFLAVEIFAAGHGEDQILSFRTNVDEIVSVDGAHPLMVTYDPVTGEPSPYVRLRDGIDARLSRAVYYDLIDRGVARRTNGRVAFGVWSNGHFFDLGTLDPQAGDDVDVADGD